jgi:cell division transport system permease protein
MSLSAKGVYFWRSAWHGIVRQPYVNAIAILTVAIALFALGMARLLDTWVQATLTQLGGEVELTVFLSNAAGPEEIDAISRLLEARTGVHPSVVSPEQALTRLRDELKDAADALDHLPGNPLPTSLELKVPEAWRTPERLATLSAELRARPEVSAVDYGEEAVSRLTAIARALRWGGGVAFLVVLAVAIAIVAATLQLAIYARRDELEIQRLVGATDRFVRAPFVLEGLLQGVMGAAVAAAALFGFLRWMGPKLSALVAFATLPTVNARGFGPMLVLELFAAGAALGLTGSFVAAGRHIRV